MTRASPSGRRAGASDAVAPGDTATSPFTRWPARSLTLTLTLTLALLTLISTQVAYSEHSSFDELRACVRDLAPSRIIPTVNCHRADKVRAMLQMLRPVPPSAPQNGAPTT